MEMPDRPDNGRWVESSRQKIGNFCKDFVNYCSRPSMTDADISRLHQEIGRNALDKMNDKLWDNPFTYVIPSIFIVIGLAAYYENKFSAQ
jgi:hypothetical protein